MDPPRRKRITEADYEHRRLSHSMPNAAFDDEDAENCEILSQEFCW